MIKAPMTEPVRLERILPFLTLTVFLDLVGFGIILPLLPSYIHDMGGNPQTVGVLLASFAASQLVATPVLGRISDRYGRRRVIVQSLIANVIAMVIFAIAASRHALWLLFVSRLVAGATSGNIGACQAAIADIAEGPDRVRAMGRLGAGIGLGMMLGPWIGGRASAFGEVAPPLAAGAMALVALVGVFVFLPETNPAVVSAEPGAKPAPRPRLSLRALMSNPKIAIVMSLYFLSFLYMTNLATALALLASDRFEWGKDKVSDLFGLFGLVSLITQFVIVGPLSRRVASANVVLGAGVLAAIALATIGLTPVPVGMVAGIVMLAMAVGLTQPQLASLATHFAGPAQQGTVLGFSQASGSLSRAIGPLLWGALYQHFGPTASFVGGALAAICAAVVSRYARAD
jgi:MFS family permease